MKRLLMYAGKRLVFIPFAVFIIVSLSFWIVNIVPSDPARVKLGDLASPKDIDATNRALGLDSSLLHRYFEYIRNVFLHFNLGRSFYTDRPVWNDIVQYLPSSIELVFLAMIVALVLGISIGTFAAYFYGEYRDHLARGFIVIIQSIPDFFLGLILIYVLFYLVGWAPAPTGQLGLLDIPPPTRTHVLLLDSALAGEWGVFKSAFTHAILPVLTLGISVAAILAKTTRSAVARALNSYQVEFARACGLPERQVFAYAFRVARTPIITYSVILFATLIGGDAIVETVFSWGGIGQWLVGRLQQLDLPEMQGIILVLGIVVLVLLIFLDILIVLLDPRVSYE